MLFFSALLAIIVILWRHFQDSPSVQQQADQLRAFVGSSFPVAQNIHLRLSDLGFRFPDLADAVQKQLDYRLHAVGCPYRYLIIDDIPDYIERPDRNKGPEPVFYTEADVLSGRSETVTKSPGKHSIVEKLEPSPNSRQNSESENSSTQKTESSANGASVPPEYSVQLHFWYEPTMWLDPDNFTVNLSYDLGGIHRNDLPFFITQAIFDILIAPDLAMWNSTMPFSAYVPEYSINIIGAEESGSPAPEIMAALQEALSKFKAVEPMTHVTSCIEPVDVSKKLIPKQYLRNTTKQVTFLFSTSLKPYADHVQGIPLFHLEKHPRLESVPGAEYGTARDQIVERITHDSYDISDFVQGANLFIESALGLPEGDDHIGLRVDAAMKHYTVQGIYESLELFLSHGESQDASLLEIYNELCALIDTILSESSHDWSYRLSQVSAIHKKLQRKD